ncbi:hypothetical protein FRIGORI9N_120037 [Frigoribacterium sp. 9N]|nr:hypothetical protein FRIGORI9N_120037 [Frigoribacterium sp. 9N]
MVREPPAGRDVGDARVPGSRGDQVGAHTFEPQPSEVGRRGRVEGPAEAFLQAADARGGRRRQVGHGPVVSRIGAQQLDRAGDRPAARLRHGSPQRLGVVVALREEQGVDERSFEVADGERVLEDAVLPPGRLVDDSYRLQHDLSARRQVELRVEFEPGDGRRLEQVLELALQFGAGDHQGDLREAVAAVEVDRSAGHEDASGPGCRVDPPPAGWAQDGPTRGGDVDVVVVRLGRPEADGPVEPHVAERQPARAHGVQFEPEVAGRARRRELDGEEGLAEDASCLVDAVTRGDAVSGEHFWTLREHLSTLPTLGGGQNSPSRESAETPRPVDGGPARSLPTVEVRRCSPLGDERWPYPSGGRATVHRRVVSNGGPPR